jgi:succinyl-CoA synthetase beta subunit
MATTAPARQIAAAIAGPVVLRAVLTGGRMKAGGGCSQTLPSTAAAAEDPGARDQRSSRAASWSRGAGRGAELLPGSHWDSIAKLLVMILSDMGGIDIEGRREASDHIAKKHFSTLLPFPTSGRSWCRS